MPSSSGTPRLTRLFAEHPTLKDAVPDWAAPRTDARIALYDRVFPWLEARMWQADDAGFAHGLETIQALSREQQALIGRSGAHRQHDFILGIPVADRPAHLRQCLESILQQCRLYGYGGQDAAGRYAKFTVVVAEDSRDPAAIAEHRAMAKAFCDQGLTVVHFDLPEQAALLAALPEAERARLGRLLTTQPPERFWHKGQAANRNLCILKMRQLALNRENTLFYLVDSDQSFQVNRRTAAGEASVPALNYFHCIDRIFREHDVRVLSGKLVGDPPVSPAVMAANFLDDMTAFLARMGTCKPHAACSFHAPDAPLPGDAAYHDHANLFGFAAPPLPFDYLCPLAGPHDHAACLDGYTARLSGFFFGEHLTRRTGFQYVAGAGRVPLPARTIYPGNTVARYEGLKYIIPFGHLRLRMSGPTAGRLIRAEIGARFATVNLPMLHARTASAELADEFRPGVEQGTDAGIDIADEFERQFFGDLMLFSVEAWLERHDLAGLDDAQAVEATVRETEARLLASYADKHQAVNTRLDELERWLAAAPADWPDRKSRIRLTAFLRAMRVNFGDTAPAWQQIQSVPHRAARRAQIVDALTHYQEERRAWDRLVS